MLVNTQYFTKEGRDFLKNGYYTNALGGTKDFFDYWHEQKARCLYGYKVGDLWIPGKMYFYLNFFPMLISPSRDDKDRNKVSAGTGKIVGFPKFMEVQLNWWNAKHIAWNGSIFNDETKLQEVVKGMGSNEIVSLYPSEVIKDIDHKSGLHMVCGKTRACGFSYMDASEGVYNYNFIPKSKNFYTASGETFLIGKDDGVLNKCWDGLDHLNQNTGNFWRKLRQEKNTDFIKKASYVDSKGDARGYKSSISGIIVDNPRKLRGARGLKLTYEEAGSYPDLISCIETGLPLVTDDGISTGQISVFGTGGEEGVGIEGLELLFYNPDTWGFMAFNNIWELGDEIGFFVPANISGTNFMDKDGNPDVKSATAYHDNEKKKRRETKSSINTAGKYEAEYPSKPSEIFRRNKKNIFSPIAESIRDQLLKVKLSKNIQGLIQYGDIYYREETKKWDFKIGNGISPIKNYPHNQKEDLTGCVTIYERPEKNKVGVVNDNQYFIVVDPYYLDEAKDKTSLWCCYVLKRGSLSNNFSNTIVASYIGRPLRLDDCYMRTLGLSEYYNCTIQSEIAGGGKGLLDYLRRKNKEHRAEFEPTTLNNKEIDKGNSNRNYFMAMPTDRKLTGLAKLSDWLITVCGLDLEGNEIINLNRIFDEGFLEELLKFNLDGNFDRISAMILAMFMFEEKAEMEVIEAVFKTDFFSRSFFGGEQTKKSNFLPSDVI